jgi:hypothetical protein
MSHENLFSRVALLGHLTLFRALLSSHSGRGQKALEWQYPVSFSSESEERDCLEFLKESFCYF